MFFNRAPVNPFSRALSCGFSTELLLAYRALGGRHGNMVLCVLFTRASYHNKVPSALPLLCPQPCEAHRSMGLLKFEASPLFISKTFNLTCFHLVGIRPWQPVWIIEEEASATSGVEMWQRQETADGRLWLLPTGPAAVESDFKGPHLLSVACFLDGCVKYVPRIYYTSESSAVSGYPARSGHFPYDLLARCLVKPSVIELYCIYT